MTLSTLRTELSRLIALAEEREAWFREEGWAEIDPKIHGVEQGRLRALREIQQLINEGD